MPETKVVFYKDNDGSVRVLDWLNSLKKRDKRIFAKAYAAIELLKEYGHELRRPYQDILRDSIHELRVEFNGVHYRLLYFIHDRTVAILTNGCTKERVVPIEAIVLAKKRRDVYMTDPDQHTYKEEADENDI